METQSRACLLLRILSRRCALESRLQQRMQDASPISTDVLASAPEYIPVPPLSYEAAEEYAMGMLSALQGTAALGAGLHIAGSLFIVYGQTLVKVCFSHCQIKKPLLQRSTTAVSKPVHHHYHSKLKRHPFVLILHFIHQVCETCRLLS